ncbi:MAG TPA: di-trans,poly-cis-decaprenylcistransferase, partial [Hyphomicrobiaceae bacterium]|nr:di-trans,poly-cis-decaprenylcistransferase [Hyphomicrobiaceae bacterium]
MQSSWDCKDTLHVAIIMDGNGRWALARGLPRSRGHRAGVEAVRQVVEAAPGLGITALTLFAFSADNWHRPRAEVAALMALIDHYVRGELQRLVASGVRLTIIGRRNRLPDDLSALIAAAEMASAAGNRLDLTIAIDYSARDAIADAVARWRFRHAPSRLAFGRLLAPRAGVHADVDLLIRSGGEKRLSDFLLWEAAYAELHFVDTLWPDFGAVDLDAAVAAFHRRQRR